MIQPQPEQEANSTGGDKKQPTNQSHNALWKDLSKNHWWDGLFYHSKEFAPFVGGK